MTNSKEPYMYMFVREDLSGPQKIVQTAHAVDELRRNVNHSDRTCYMILFGVKNQEELVAVNKFLNDNGVSNEMFYEPDVNQYTAIATEQLVGEQRALMSGFKLFR